MSSIKFRPDQLLAYNGLCWLLDPAKDGKGEGRTFVIASAILQTAIDNPGIRIPVFDHVVGGHIMKTIIYLAKDLPWEVACEAKSSCVWVAPKDPSVSQKTKVEQEDNTLEEESVRPKIKEMADSIKTGSALWILDGKQLKYKIGGNTTTISFNKTRTGKVFTTEVFHNLVPLKLYLREEHILADAVFDCLVSKRKEIEETWEAETNTILENMDRFL